MIKLTKEEFNHRLFLIHPTLKLISDYNGLGYKVKVKDIISKYEYEILASNLLIGKYPSLGSAINSTFIYNILMKEGTNYKYEFIDFKFIKVINKVKCNCKIHGEFKKEVRQLIKGKGCPYCVKENQGGWSYIDWKNMSKHSNLFDSFKLYIIKCWNDEEEFYKIGKTYTTIGKRFGYGNTTKLPYNYKIIKIIEGSAKYISDLEKKLQIKHDKYKYKPRILFKGYTECFNQLQLANSY